MAMQVVVHDKEVRTMLTRLDIAISPVGLATFLGVVVDPYLKGRAGQRFLQEGDDVTGSWAPLKPATQTIRSEMGFGAAHPINVRTGELERYIVEGDNRITAHAAGATLTMPGHDAAGELFDKVSRAQGGDSRTVPRPVLGMNERDLLAVLMFLSQHVEKLGTAL